MHIHELRLAAHDLERQRDFYTRVLELPLQAADARQFTVIAGATALTFTAAAPHSAVNYHFAFNVPEHLFAEAKHWLAARVPLVLASDGKDEFHFADWNAHAIYFDDPEGNIGELIARHDLPSAHSGPFSRDHLLNISEIGITVHDVGAFAPSLAAQTRCPLYRGSLSDEFAVLGDEHGLFIVVKRERLWFASTRRALESPLEVRFAQGDSRFRLEGPPPALIRLA